MTRSLAILALASLVVATGAQSFPIVSRRTSINPSRRVNIVHQDHARIASLVDRATGAKTPAPVPGINLGNDYAVQFSVGTPSNKSFFLIDTSSAVTWISNDKYVLANSSTGASTPDTFSVSYVSGSASGVVVKDTIVFSPELTVTKQSIGIANVTKAFEDVDGVLALGPQGLTRGTLTPDSNKTIPTVTDNLYAQGKIQSNSVSFYFEPAVNAPIIAGEILFGGVNASKAVKPFTYTPVTKTSPSSEFWGLDMAITYGSSTTITKKVAGIIDASTSLINLEAGAYKAYQQATGGARDSATGLLSITPEQYKGLKNVTLAIGGTELTLTPNAQIWPRELNTAIGGKEKAIYLVITDLKAGAGDGLAFVLGYPMLERFYTHLDSDKKRIGFAPTAFTYATTN